MINIQKQSWRNLTRYILFAENGSAQLEIYKTPHRNGAVSAYFWALWVEPMYRRRGIARQLLRNAERLARIEGQKILWLEWRFDDAVWPDENHSRNILAWYERLGYKKIDFSDDYALLQKKL